MQSIPLSSVEIKQGQIYIILINLHVYVTFC